jgi:hypothetical protein
MTDLETRLRAELPELAASVTVDRQGTAGGSRRTGRWLAVAAGLAVVTLAAGVMWARNTDTAQLRVQGHSASPTSTSSTATTSSPFPQIAGMTIVSDGNGPVGYALTDQVLPRSVEAIRAQNARTLIPVTLGDGTLVGYIAPGVSFIPLAEAQHPGFDIEAVRARLNGGCEPQIGDPTFKQKFPRCPPPPNNPVTPTLGRRYGPYQRGFGQARPSSIFLGGDPTGMVNGIHWESWGGARATGNGTGYYVPPGKIVADGVRSPATVVAFNLGICDGKRAYQAVEWFFPQHGETFNPGTYINICTGENVGAR